MAHRDLTRQAGQAEITEIYFFPDFLSMLPVMGDAVMGDVVTF